MHTYNPKPGVYGICETCGEDIEWHIAQSHAAIAAIREAMRRTPILSSTSASEDKRWRIKPQSCQSNGAGWCPKALVRIVEDGILHMQIMPDRMFDTKQGADAYAVKMAKSARPSTHNQRSSDEPPSGDRFSTESGEREVVGRPYSSTGGKMVHA